MDVELENLSFKSVSLDPERGEGTHKKEPINNVEVTKPKKKKEDLNIDIKKAHGEEPHISNSKDIGVSPLETRPKRSNSETKSTTHETEVLQRTKSSTLKRIFSRSKKNVSTNGLSYAKLKQDLEEEFQENANLNQTIIQLQQEIEEKSNEIENLKREAIKLKDEISNNDEVIERNRKIEAECTWLKRQLNTIRTESGDLHVKLAFLQEERDEKTNEIEALQDDYQRLQYKWHVSEKDRNKFQTRCVQLESRIHAVLNNICTEMCHLVEQNRCLIKQGSFRGNNPQQLFRVLQTTEDFLRLKSEHSRLLVQLEKMNERIVAHEVYVSDLKIELRSALDLIMKSGLEYTCELEATGPEYYLNIIRSEDAITVSDTKPDDAGEGTSGGENVPDPAGKPDLHNLTGKALFNHMRNQMTEKIVNPSAKMVSKGLQSLGNNETLKTLLPVVALSTGRSPTQAVATTFCDKYCSCVKNCIKSKTS